MSYRFKQADIAACGLEPVESQCYKAADASFALNSEEPHILVLV